MLRRSLQELNGGFQAPAFFALYIKHSGMRVAVEFFSSLVSAFLVQ